jgi:hypothetical protein
MGLAMAPSCHSKHSVVLARIEGTAPVTIVIYMRHSRSSRGSHGAESNTLPLKTPSHDCFGFRFAPAAAWATLGFRMGLGGWLWKRVFS